MESTQRGGATALSKERKVTATLLWVAIIASFGSLQYGYNLWVIYSPAVLMHTFQFLDEEEKEHKSSDTPSFLLTMALAMSVFPLGGATGSLVFGTLVDRSGRKGALFLNSFFSVIASLIMAFANMLQSFGLVMFAYFAIGITIGIYSSGTPLYLAEISPVHSRGAIGLVSHFFLALGLVGAQILSFTELLGTDQGLQVMMSLSGIMALVQCLLMTSFPESPRYLLIQRRNEEQARQALKNLRSRCDVEDEIEELYQEDISEKAEKDMNALKLLTYRDLRWQVITIIVLMVSQQFSGVNWIYYYASKVYLTTGIGAENERYIKVSSAIVMMGTLLFAMTVVDSKGRKVLLLVGYGVISILCLFLTMTLEIQKNIKWMPIANSIILNIFFNMQVLGPGSLRFLLMAELFRQSSRSSAYVVGGFTHWIVHLFTIIVYVQIKEYAGAFVFLLSFLVCLATFVYIYKVMPETKNRTFLDIYKLACMDKKAAFDVRPD